MKKPRSDAKLKSLPQEQQDLLSEWLTKENISYSQARLRVKKQFGISTSLASLQDFYSAVAVPWKYAQARNLAQEIADLKKGEFKPALVKRIEQIAFELSVNQRVDIKALKAFVKMLTDSEKVELQKGNLRLALDKFKQSLKTDVEKGLDALHAELKGNEEALALFDRMKAIVMASVEAAK
jgi:hypothetical protein